jgi:hypothetical protein
VFGRSFLDEMICLWGYGKNIKMLYSTADDLAVSKDKAVSLVLLERAFKAANSANVGFSTYG